MAQTSVNDDYNCNYRISSFWNIYKSWIIFFGIIAALSSIVVVIVLNNNNTPTIPCLLYGPQTLANEVSIACLQYLWDFYCQVKRPYTFSSTYSGYWNRSPKGTSMVICNQNPVCGIGSYGNILNYMQFCNNVV